MSDTNISAVIAKDHYKVVLTARKNTITADEPQENGGGDTGMNPHEILASSLGACTCATLRMYADRKAWPLEGVNVTINLTHDDDNNTHIRRDIELVGATLTEEQKSRLMEIADKCPIHKTLTNPILIQSTMKI